MRLIFAALLLAFVFFFNSIELSSQSEGQGSNSWALPPSRSGSISQGNSEIENPSGPMYPQARSPRGPGHLQAGPSTGRGYLEAGSSARRVYSEAGSSTERGFRRHQRRPAPLMTQYPNYQPDGRSGAHFQNEIIPYGHEEYFPSLSIRPRPPFLVSSPHSESGSNTVTPTAGHNDHNGHNNQGGN